MPGHSMCMIIDGAEQSLHCAPRFNGLAPTRDGCKLKITGAILHGHRATVFVSAPHLPTGANLTCTLIDHVLNDNTTLPPHFRLQVDGASDNWSLVVFAHLEALVRHRAFLSARAARNTVGFTHDDIDAFFALLKGALEAIDVLSYEEFCDAIRKATETFK